MTSFFVIQSVLGKLLKYTLVSQTFMWYSPESRFFSWYELSSRKFVLCAAMSIHREYHIKLRGTSLCDKIKDDSRLYHIIVSDTRVYNNLRKTYYIPPKNLVVTYHIIKLYKGNRDICKRDKNILLFLVFWVMLCQQTVCSVTSQNIFFSSNSIYEAFSQQHLCLLKLK